MGIELGLLTDASIMCDEIFCTIIEEKDPVFRDKMIWDLKDRARSLGVKAKFDERLKAYLKAEKQQLVESKSTRFAQQSLENWTSFNAEKYTDLFCGNWIADKSGVRTFSMFGECLACYHPILPIERLTNIETGTEKIVLAFLKGERWREITVDKERIATAQKITALSNLGVAVTSENAKYLVRYLSDVENANLAIIPEHISTSRMGWIDGEFMPYTANVLFDGDDKFKTTFDAIHEKGSYDKWLDMVLYYRAKGRVELKFYLAASFASVLVKPLNALPFWCNVHGGTGAGKTVAEMIAVSIWADPGENKYCPDFADTIVSTELRMDFLNNLPVVMDDTAKVKEKYGDNFSKLIYTLCSGRGKGRSNRDLGLSRVTTWQNVIFSSGENPLSTEALQGGAMNRILDLEASSVPIFDDGQAAVDIILQNHGFAGKLFIDLIKEIGIERITEIQKEIFEQLKEQKKMEKQSLSLSILLTADRLVTDYIFKDRQYIDVKDVEHVLNDPVAVSENERCYDYVLGEVAMNPNKFKVNDFGDYQGEMWGLIQNGYALILKNAFDRICKNGGYSSKGFLSWADKNGLLQTAKGRKDKQKKVNGSTAWFIFLKLKDENYSDLDFEEVQEDDSLPFIDE